MFRDACLVTEDANCIANAQSEFNAWTLEPLPDTNNPINRNLRYAIYCTVVYNGGQAEVDFLNSIYANNYDPQERRHIRSGISCSQNRAILEQQLDAILDRRVEDSFAIFETTFRNKKGRQVALEWLNRNEAVLKKQFRKLHQKMQEFTVVHGNL